MSQILNILYQSDDNYAPIMGVSMTSLFENNKDIDEINAYILNDNIGEENIVKIKKLCGQYERKVVFIEGEPIIQKLKELNVTTWRGKYTAWLKLFSMSLLPAEQFLYLDCDTLIIGSLAALCNFDFDGNIMAATNDYCMDKYKQLIGVPSADRCYSVGVILFDQKSWTNGKCEEQIINHIKNVRNNYYLPEQDIFNVLFRHRIKCLDMAYNYLSGFYIFGIEEFFKIYEYNLEYYNIEEVKRAHERPVVLHCDGAMTGRPWEKNNTHPHSALFDKYLKMSPWHDYEKIVVKRSFLFTIQRVLFKLLPKPLYIPLHRTALKRYLNRMNKKVMVDQV